MSDSRKPGWITHAAFAAVALTGAYGFLEETTIRTTIAAAVLSGLAAFHVVAAFKILRRKARPRTAAAASEVAFDSSVVARDSVPLVCERASALTRVGALAEIGRGDWASAKAGLRWFVENATGEQDWLILVDGLRFPNNLAPREIAAEALVKRYGTEGLYECLRYLDREDVEGNTHWHIQSVLEELYLVEDIPVRAMLREISTAAKYSDQKPYADELLDTHNLSAGGQGVLKKTTT